MTPGNEITKRPVLLYLQDKATNSVVREGLKQLGFLNLRTFDSEENLKTDLQLLKSSLLILDWNGAQTANILSKSIANESATIRPVYMVIKLSEPNILNILSDFLLTIVQAAPLTADLVKKALHTIYDERSPVFRMTHESRVLLEAKKQKGLPEVEVLLRQLTEKYPDNLRFRADLAANLIDQGEWEEANQITNEILLLDRNLPRALHLKARCSLHEEKPEDAEEYMKKSVLLNPFNINNLIGLGNIFIENSKIDEAKEIFTKADILSPKDPRIIKGLASCELISGQINSGLCFLQQLGSESEMAAVFNNSGIVCVRKNDLDSAKKLYKIAESMLTEPLPLSKVTFNCSLAYFRSGDRDNGLAYLKKSITINPGFKKAQNLYASQTQKARTADMQYSDDVVLDDLDERF
jgi:tetratricopeptide (TPR) repeat protein